MKYALIFKTFNEYKRGGNTTSYYLKNINPDKIDCFDIGFANIEELRKSYNLVFVTQATSLYKHKYNFTKAIDSDVVYIRHEHLPKLFKNPVNNGFSYTKDSDIKYFSPFLYNFSITKHKTINNVKLGVYVRYGVTPENIRRLRDFLKNIPKDIELVTYGDYFEPDNRKHTHTINSKEFFSTISHYIYFRPRI